MFEEKELSDGCENATTSDALLTAVWNRQRGSLEPHSYSDLQSKDGTSTHNHKMLIDMGKHVLVQAWVHTKLNLYTYTETLNGVDTISTHTADGFIALIIESARIQWSTSAINRDFIVSLLN